MWNDTSNINSLEALINLVWIFYFDATRMEASPLLGKLLARARGNFCDYLHESDQLFLPKLHTNFIIWVWFSSWLPGEEMRKLSEGSRLFLRGYRVSEVDLDANLRRFSKLMVSNIFVTASFYQNINDFRPHFYDHWNQN